MKIVKDQRNRPILFETVPAVSTKFWMNGLLYKVVYTRRDPFRFTAELQRVADSESVVGPTVDDCAQNEENEATNSKSVVKEM